MGHWSSLALFLLDLAALIAGELTYRRKLKWEMEYLVTVEEFDHVWDSPYPQAGVMLYIFQKVSTIMGPPEATWRGMS